VSIHKSVFDEGHIKVKARGLIGACREQKPEFNDKLARYFMDFCSKDEELKNMALRFTSVLASLKNPKQINDLFRQYFNGVDFPLVQLAIFLSAIPGISNLSAASVKWLAEQTARYFIAGSNIMEARKNIWKMRQEGALFTLDILGEAVLSESEAENYLQNYLDLIASFGPTGNWANEINFQPNFSIKPSSLYSQFDPISPETTSEVVKERLRRIFRAAKKTNAFINIDMEQYYFRDLTLDIFKEVLMEKEFIDWEDIGIVAQAYLRDSEKSLLKLLDWVSERETPITIRLVKGAYWDHEIILRQHQNRRGDYPIYLKKWQTDENFEKLALLLLSCRPWVRTAIGSHNLRSIAVAMSIAEKLGLPKEEKGTDGVIRNPLEFQILYGMGNGIKKPLLKSGFPVRVYTPYVTSGSLIPGMAYLVRRILENTSNESFLRSQFIGNSSMDELIQCPLEAKQKEKGGRK